MKIADMIAVMKAHDQGQAIQYRSNSPSPGDVNYWKDTDKPLWNWAVYDYRVKASPRRVWIAENFTFISSSEELTKQERAKGRVLVEYVEVMDPAQ